LGAGNVTVRSDDWQKVCASGVAASLSPSGVSSSRLSSLRDVGYVGEVMQSFATPARVPDA
jgi:hypothetical protein